MQQPSDEDLVAEAGRGSTEAFQALFRRWAPRLGRFLVQATGSADAAEDLLQEAFLRVICAAARYRTHGSARAWLYRICANLAYSHWRRRRTSPLVEVGDPGLLDDVLAVSGTDPEQLFMANAFVEAARDAVGRLSANHRMVFLLKIDQGLTYEEIAEVLECPVGTAKSRYHHAVRKLRADLAEWRERPAPHWRR